MTNYVDTFVSYVVADSNLNANVIYALEKDTKLTNTSGLVLGAVRYHHSAKGSRLVQQHRQMTMGVALQEDMMQTAQIGKYHWCRRISIWLAKMFQ